MIKSLSYRTMIVVAALLMAMTSVGSAARMAPSDMDRAEVAAFLAIGGTLADICEDGEPHDHAKHCPFCNTTAQATVIAPAGNVWTLAPDPLLLTFAAFEMGEQRQNSQRFARGPPTST